MASTPLARINQLQRGWTSREEQLEILDIFLQARGAELTALKQAVELSGPGRDLLDLASDLSEPVWRELKDHFAREAQPTQKLKLYTDIDDTFYASYKDRSYPKKIVYPGLRALFRALGGDVAVLSARPGFLERMTLRTLKANGLQATMLQGDLLHVLGNDRIADKKLSNFNAHRALWPSNGTIFFGDSGQGDAICGAKMLRQDPNMRGVFIHNVTHMSAAAKAAMAKNGIVVFDTYVDAAIVCFERGLITKEALGEIMRETRAEHDAVAFDSPAQKRRADAELAEAMAAAAASLDGVSAKAP